VRERATRRGGAAGFGLVEVVIAAGLLIAVAVGVSQIVAVTVRASYAARVRTIATLLAAQKMEQLRSLAWRHAWSGMPAVRVRLSDLSTDLSNNPPTGDGPGLRRSPPGTLDSNVPFYVDYLDAAGAWAGRGPSPPAGAVYVRRWAVHPLPSEPDDILVLEVLVTAARTSLRAIADARLVSVMSRRP
jgi:hypothetical protein